MKYLVVKSVLQYLRDKSLMLANSNRVRDAEGTDFNRLGFSVLSANYSSPTYEQLNLEISSRLAAPRLEVAFFVENIKGQITVIPVDKYMDQAVEFSNAFGLKLGKTFDGVPKMLWEAHQDSELASFP